MQKKFLFFSEIKVHIFFKKCLCPDDGKYVDENTGDSVFSALIPLADKKTEYYIFAENQEAALFSPERAAHEFYIFKKKARNAFLKKGFKHK